MCNYGTHDMFCPPVSICVRKYVWMEVAGGLLDSALSELIFSQTYCEAAGGTVAVLWGDHGATLLRIGRLQAGGIVTHRYTCRTRRNVSRR
jgi:hypothetical protein